MRIIASMHGHYHGRTVENIYMKNSEAAVEGRAYKLANGRWTAASVIDPVEAICRANKPAGTDVFGVMEIVKEGDIVLADYTGEPTATFLPGLALANLDATGDNVNAAADTGTSKGHLVVLDVDTVNKTVKFIARKNFTQE